MIQEHTGMDIFMSIRRQDLSIPDSIDKLQDKMLCMPQVECPVVHRFGPGLYIREVSVPAGSFIIGYKHKQSHFNMLLKGKATVLLDDGDAIVMSAPLSFTAQSGRKVAYVHEDMVWLNIFATDETDVDKLEAIFFDKSSEIKERLDIGKLKLLPVKAERDDYMVMLTDYELTEAMVRSVSERTEDLIPFPHGDYSCKIGRSAIEGHGLIATANIKVGDIIAPARIGNCRTPAGRYANHSPTSNAIPVKWNDGIYFAAIKPIRGCMGGYDGDEITVDYRQCMAIAMEMDKEGKSCQE